MPALRAAVVVRVREGRSVKHLGQFLGHDRDDVLSAIAEVDDMIRSHGIRRRVEGPGLLEWSRAGVPVVVSHYGVAAFQWIDQQGIQDRASGAAHRVTYELAIPVG